MTIAAISLSISRRSRGTPVNRTHIDGSAFPGWGTKKASRISTSVLLRGR
jgi:hypothetical protein